MLRLETKQPTTKLQIPGVDVKVEEERLLNAESKQLNASEARARKLQRKQAAIARQIFVSNEKVYSGDELGKRQAFGLPTA